MRNHFLRNPIIPTLPHYAAVLPHVRLVPALQSLLTAATPPDVGVLVLQRLADALQPSGPATAAAAESGSQPAADSGAGGTTQCGTANRSSEGGDDDDDGSGEPLDASRDARSLFAASGGVALVQRVGRVWAQRAAEAEAEADAATAESTATAADGYGVRVDVATNSQTAHPSKPPTRAAMLAAVAAVNARFPAELVDFHTPGYATTVLAARLRDGADGEAVTR